MKPKDLVFPVAIIIVVGFLYYLSTTGKKPPVIPADPQHMSAKTKEDCLACHAPGKASPLKESHPPKDQCFECHKFRAGQGAGH